MPFFSALKASILTSAPHKYFSLPLMAFHSVGEKKKNRNATLGKNDVMLHQNNFTDLTSEIQRFCFLCHVTWQWNVERFPEKLLCNSRLGAEIMYIACKALSSSFYAKVVFLRFIFVSPRLKPKSHEEVWLKQCRGPAELLNLSEMKNTAFSLSARTCWVEPGYDKYFQCCRFGLAI